MRGEEEGRGDLGGVNFFFYEYTGGCSLKTVVLKNHEGHFTPAPFLFLCFHFRTRIRPQDLLIRVRGIRFSPSASEKKEFGAPGMSKSIRLGKPL